MEQRRKPGGKKYEPFRVNVKVSVKDAPIFDLDDEPKKPKVSDRRIVTLESSTSKVAKDHMSDDGGRDGNRVGYGNGDESNIIGVDVEGGGSGDGVGGEASGIGKEVGDGGGNREGDGVGDVSGGGNVGGNMDGGVGDGEGVGNKDGGNGVDGDGARMVVEKESEGMKDCDILEVNAELDSCIEKDGDTAAEEKIEQKGSKKHKKSEKREKKKKRKKDKSDEETREKRHKKNHHDRNKDGDRRESGSRSLSPAGRRRLDSGSRCAERRMRNEYRDKSHSQTRDRSRDRDMSRDGSRGRRNSRGEWRYSPTRVESRVRSRSRSPVFRTGHMRGRRDPPPDEFGRDMTSSMGRKSVGDPLPGDKSPRVKSPRDKSPKDKSPRDKLLEGKAKGKGKTKREKSKEKFHKGKFERSKSPMDTTSTGNTSADNTSPVKIVKSSVVIGKTSLKSPSLKSPSLKSPSLKSPSLKKHITEKSPKQKSPDDGKKVKSLVPAYSNIEPSKTILDQNNVDQTSGKSTTTGKSPRPGESTLPSKSPLPGKSSPTLGKSPPTPGKSSPREKSPRRSVSPPNSSSRKFESPRNTPGDLPVPVGVVAPYVVEDMSISETDNTDGGGTKFVDLEVTDEDHTKDVYKGISAAGGNEKKKKKPKIKKKEKKENGEKKQKKKKQKGLGKSGKAGGVGEVRNQVDDLEDLLFTKTVKETKFEDVFHDAEVVTAKHDFPPTFLDMEPRRMKTAEVEEVPVVISQTVVDTSPVPSPGRSAEVYEPEERTKNTEEPAVLEPPPTPPVIPGFTPTIPFLSVKEEITEEKSEVNVSELAVLEQDTTTDAGVAYSPLENDILPASDYESSPGDHNSTVHLSDISTKESNVDSTVGVITRQEKIEDFLCRMPGSFQQQTNNESGVVDMDMSSPGAGEESDDDIIEQLHKEFVKAQEKGQLSDAAVPQEDIVDNSWVPVDYMYDNDEPVLYVSPKHDINDDPIVISYHQERLSGATGRKSKSGKRKRKGGKSKRGKDGQPFAKEKKDIEDALDRVHRQARVEDEMKYALKNYFKRKDITKDEYKMILRKAVPQVANSTHGIDPERVRSLAKKYVAKCKGWRLCHPNTDDTITFSP